MDAKRKAVISADAEDLERVESLVRERRYKTVSEFMREAMREKLDRVAAARLAEEVERYCAAGHADEDTDLIPLQPLAAPKGRRAKG